MRNFILVKVDHKYCDYLRKFDSRVMYNAGVKELKPFIGVLFKVNDKEYYAPLSSPKPKHSSLRNTLDIIKIDNGNYGIINFNNMIPVTKNNYEVIDLYKKIKNESELKRQKLLKAQLRWLNNNYKYVSNKAIRMYNLYINNNLPKRVQNRCCNFRLLESKCSEYNNIKVS